MREAVETSPATACADVAPPTVFTFAKARHQVILVACVSRQCPVIAKCLCRRRPVGRRWPQSDRRRIAAAVLRDGDFDDARRVSLRRRVPRSARRRPGLTLLREIPLPGPANRFDYQSVDPATRRLYMNHMNAGQTLVFDVDSDRVVAEIGMSRARPACWPYRDHHRSTSRRPATTKSRSSMTERSRWRRASATFAFPTASRTRAARTRCSSPTSRATRTS